MRRTVVALFTILFMLALFGCPPPDPNDPKAKFRTAYMTIAVAKATIKIAYGVWQGVEENHRLGCTEKVCYKLHPDKTSAAFKACMATDQSAVAEFKTCYGKMGDAKRIIDKAVPLSLSVLDDTKDSIDFAVEYQIAKDAKEAQKDPVKLKEFCDKAYPSKIGDEYQNCLAGKDVKKADWSGFLKARCCTVDKAFAFIPDKWAKYVETIRAWFRAYGNCKS